MNARFVLAMLAAALSGTAALVPVEMRPVTAPRHRAVPARASTTTRVVPTDTPADASLATAQAKRDRKAAKRLAERRA